MIFGANYVDRFFFQQLKFLAEDRSFTVPYCLCVLVDSLCTTQPIVDQLLIEPLILAPEARVVRISLSLSSNLLLWSEVGILVNCFMGKVSVLRVSGQQGRSSSFGWHVQLNKVQFRAIDDI